MFANHCAFFTISVLLDLLPPTAMASALDSEAAFLDRLQHLGVSDPLKQELLDQGFKTFGALAFAVSATPQALTDEALRSVDQKVDGRSPDPFSDLLPATASVRKPGLGDQ